MTDATGEWPVWPIDRLLSNPRNYRQHPEPQLAALRANLARHGQQKPVVIQSDGTIIAGHALVAAARGLGWEAIGVHIYDGSDPDAFLVDDNESARLAVDDDQALAVLLRERLEVGTLDSTGWNEDEVRELLDRIKAEQHEIRCEDPGPGEAPENPITRPGDLWLLGGHRLLCGDCTAPENWDRLMGTEIAQAVVTDPPYAVSYCGGRAAQEERIAKARRGVDQPSDAYWDELTPALYLELLKASLGHAYRWSDDKAPLYLWFASARIRQVIEALIATGYEERNLIVWVKNIGAGALFAQYKHRYEPQFYAFKHGHAPRWYGPTNETTVWEHDKPARNELHPTMKPVALIERAIRNSTDVGDLVLDPFLGSGTAIIAAESLSRRCYGFDLDAGYCDVIIRRWQTMTGQQAHHAETGRAFDDCASAVLPAPGEGQDVAENDRNPQFARPASVGQAHVSTAIGAADV